MIKSKLFKCPVIWLLFFLSLFYFVPPNFWVISLTINTVVKFLTFGVFSPAKILVPLMGDVAFFAIGYVVFLSILLSFYMIHRWNEKIGAIPLDRRSIFEKNFPILLIVYFLSWPLAILESLYQAFISLVEK